MRWNERESECQLYLDVDCSSVTYDTKPSAGKDFKDWATEYALSIVSISKHSQTVSIYSSVATLLLEISIHLFYPLIRPSVRNGM